MNLKKISALLLLLSAIASSSAQTGTIYEPVRYLGGVTIDPDVHDGRIRYAVGVESRQTVRVNRTHPELADDYGWTYNHASNLCYWNDTFYQQYLSNPVDEHIAPGQTLVTVSKDGRNWEKPVVVFPPYIAPAGVTIPEGYSGYMMHQRMGFYISPGGRLLVLAFYGHAEDPFREGGIGRVVREAYRDGRFGPIYFIRYSSHTSWNETNTAFPFYTASEDEDFVDACKSLLANKPITAQWWDEDRGLDGFYSFKKAGSALSWYTRKDNTIVALWKRSWCGLSFDGGVSFSEPVRVPTLTMAGGKIWGQRTGDNRYALCYNPINLDEYRYPLIIMTGDDGITYDDMLIVQGEVPPRRFYGRWKDFGPCYVRGIIEGNGNPSGDDVWITYSMNKEDMWVSRIPLPVHSQIDGPVDDNFEKMLIDGPVEDWNIYAPKWAPAGIVNFPGSTNKCLVLKDRDRFDYCRAIRVFQESEKVKLKYRVYTENLYSGSLEMEITDRFGNRPVRIILEKDGYISAHIKSEQKALTAYRLNHWYDIEILIDARPGGSFSLWIEGEKMIEDERLAVDVKSVERISFRTGPYRDMPGRRTPNQEPAPPLEDGDDPVPTAIFYIDDVAIRTVN